MVVMVAWQPVGYRCPNGHFKSTTGTFYHQSSFSPTTYPISVLYFFYQSAFLSTAFQIYSRHIWYIIKQTRSETVFTPVPSQNHQCFSFISDLLKTERWYLIVLLSITDNNCYQVLFIYLFKYFWISPKKNHDFWLFMPLRQYLGT